MLMFKRMMSLLLALVMVAGMLPYQAFAGEIQDETAAETVGETTASETVTATEVSETTAAATEATVEETTAEETAVEETTVTEPAANAAELSVDADRAQTILVAMENQNGNWVMTSAEEVTLPAELAQMGSVGASPSGVGDNSYKENESNNSMSLADMVYNDYTVSGTLSSSDLLDFFCFRLSTKSYVTVTVVASYSSLMMGIMDTSEEFLGAIQATDVTSSGNYSGFLYGTISSGTYYLCILDKNQSYNSYMFYITIEPETTSCSHSSYTSTVTAPTCADQGYTTYTCSSCGYSWTGSYTNATGNHTYDNDTDAICNVCGYERVVDDSTVASGTCGDDLTWTLDDYGTLTISGRGKMTDYSNWDTPPWYDYEEDLKKVVIEPGATSIGNYAFYSMGEIQTIQIPEGITSIGDFGIAHCGKLQSLWLPDSVTTLGYQVFNSCKSVTEVRLSKNLKELPVNAFGHCAGLTEITIPDGMETIGTQAFWNATGLVSVTIPGSVTTLGASAFKGCTALKYVTFKGDAPEFKANETSSNFQNVVATVYYPVNNPTWTESVRQNYGGTLTWVAGCTNGHTEVIVPGIAPTCTEPGISDGKTCSACGAVLAAQIELDALGHAEIVDEGIAPTCTESGVTDGKHCQHCGEIFVVQEVIAALGHTSVVDAYLVPTCEEIGLTEGSHCSVCNEVLVAQEEIPALGHSFENSFCTVCGAPDTLEGSFDGISWVLDGYGNLIISGSGEMDDNPWIDYADRIKTLTVETGVTTVGYHAFDGCTNLTEVSLPNTITEIDYYAFQNCPGLTEFTIPRRVETIGSGAFLGCTGLTEIVIPEGVTEVGSWAFEGCTGLESVTIPSTLSVLESYLFRDCTALTDVYVPEGVTEMWNSVFMGCTSLKRIHLPESLTKMSYSVFDGCTALTEVNIPSRMEVIDDYTFSGCESLKDITIPSGVAVIGRNAFWGSGLTEVTIPATVVEIGVGAFSNCQNLRGITVASKNKAYSSDAIGTLYNKDKTVLLQIPGSFTGTFVVPNTVDVIAERAAAFCHGLKGITIPEGVTTIGNSAFFRSGGLKEVIIPASVMLIDKYAFQECSALTSVTIRGTCQIMGMAFGESDALRDIWFKGDAPSFDDYALEFVTATAHYPAGNPTWTADVMQSYGGTITWEPQYEVEEVVSIQTDKKDLWPGDAATLTAILDPGVRGDVEIIWTLENSADAEVELITSGLGAMLQCYNVTKRTTVTVTARTAEGAADPVSLRVTLRPEGQVDADYTIYSGKSLQLTAYDPNTGKVYKSSEVLWELLTWDEAGNMVEADAFATISKSGKLTAKKIYETVRLEVSRTVIATGEVVTCLIDILPAVTQAEVLSGDEVVNGKTVLVDFTTTSKTFGLAVYPEDTAAEVTWTVSDAKKQQYASYTIEGDTLTVSNPTGKAGTVTVKAVVNAGVKKTVSFKLQFGSFAKTVVLMEPSVRALRGGETLSLFAYISEPRNVTKDGVVWSVSDKNAATISGGKLKAKNVAHPTVVTVTATSKDGQASASLDFEILPKNEGALVIRAGDDFVTNGTRSLNLGDTIQLHAGTILRGECVEETVYWTTNKPAVAVVDDTGLITATGTGTAKITAQASGNRKVSLTIKVTNLVRDMLLTTKDGKNVVEENGETVVVVASGKSVNLVAAVFPGNASNKMTWEVAEGGEYVKLTSSGKLTANKDLTKVSYVTVKATAADGGGCSKTIRVKVLPLATGVQIFESGIRVRSNTTFVCDMLTTPTLKLSVRVYPANAWQNVELTSSNKKIAKIDEEGNLICVKPGTVTITAKALDGSNAKTTFKFTVVKKVTSLSLKEDSDLTVVGGKTLKLAPMVEISPSDATNKKLNWRVAPNDYGITISSSGVLKTKKVTQPVTVNVMVTPQDGSGVMLSFDVTIYPA